MLGVDIEFSELHDDQAKPLTKIESAHNGELIGKGSIIVNSGFKQERDEVYLITFSASKVQAWDLGKLNI
jgi:hypothetical protein